MAKWLGVSFGDYYNKWCVYVGFTSALYGATYPTLEKAKIAVDLWWKFHMNPPKFWNLQRFLLVDPKNYNGAWGKLITIKQLRKMAVIN